MEMALSENQIAAQAPPKRRWRVQFSLGTLILLTTLAGAVMGLFFVSRQADALRAENRVLRDQVGVLTVLDPAKVNVIAGKTTDELRWRWRVYLPGDSSRQYCLCYAFHDVNNRPADDDSYRDLLGQKPSDFPQRAGEVKFLFGNDAGVELTVEVACERMLDGSWKADVITWHAPNGAVHQEVALPRDARWLQRPRHYSGWQAGSPGTKTFDPQAPIPLLRLIESKDAPTDTDNDGLLLWIEKARPARGAKP